MKFGFFFALFLLEILREGPQSHTRTLAHTQIKSAAGTEKFPSELIRDRD